MKTIPQNLHEAFLAVHNSNFEDEGLYEAYESLAKEHLGEEAWKDRDKQGELVVSLVRMVLELEGDWVKTKKSK